VPGELESSSYRGVQGAALGAAVALDGEALLAGAPGLGQVWRLDTGAVVQGNDELGRWVWWNQGRPFAAQPLTGVFDIGGEEAELLWETPGANVFAVGWMADVFRVATATAEGVQLWDEAGAILARLDQAGVQQLAIGHDRVLLIRCVEAGCEATAWRPEGEALEVLGSAGDGGAVIEVEGVAWWGDPQLERATGAGRVCAEDGRCIEGIEGDHLGRRLSSTHAAGVFNTWALPARLRLAPLDGGPVLAIDRAPPSRPPALHSQGGSLAVGLPSDGVSGWGEGRVLVVALD